MYDLMDRRNAGTCLPAGTTVTGYVAEFLSAVPMALAAPFLSYQRTKDQKELLVFLIEAKKQERSDILRTIRVLAQCGELTPELSNQLMMIYFQQPY